MNVPIVCGGVRVDPGDIIVADDDGVICIPPAEAPAVIAKARARAEREAKIRAAIEGGQVLFELLKLQDALEAAGVEEIDSAWND